MEQRVELLLGRGRHEPSDPALWRELATELERLGRSDEIANRVGALASSCRAGGALLDEYLELLHRHLGVIGDPRWQYERIWRLDAAPDGRRVVLHHMDGRDLLDTRDWSCRRLPDPGFPVSEVRLWPDGDHATLAGTEYRKGGPSRLHLGVLDLTRDELVGADTIELAADEGLAAIGPDRSVLLLRQGDGFLLLSAEDRDGSPVLLPGSRRWLSVPTPVRAAEPGDQTTLESAIPHFSPDGARLLLVCKWKHEGPDDNALTAGRSESAHVLDLESGESLARVGGSMFEARICCWSPDGQLVVLVRRRWNPGGSGYLYSLEVCGPGDLAPVRELELGQAAPAGPAWLGAEQLVVLRGLQEQVELYARDGWRLERSFSHRHGKGRDLFLSMAVERVVPCRQGRALLLQTEQTVEAVDLEDGAQVAGNLTHRRRLAWLGSSRDGELLVTLDEGCHLRAWAAGSGRSLGAVDLREVLPPGDPAEGSGRRSPEYLVGLPGGGREVAVVGHGDYAILQVRDAGLEVGSRGRISGDPDPAVMSCALLSGEGELHLPPWPAPLDPESPRTLWFLPRPDSREVLVQNRPGPLALLPGDGSPPARFFEGGELADTCFSAGAFSTDGRRLALLDDSRPLQARVVVVDVDSRRLLARSEVLETKVKALGFGPGGDRVLYGFRNHVRGFDWRT